MAEQSAVSEMAARNAAEIEKQIEHLQGVADGLADKLGTAESDKEIAELMEQMSDIDQQLQALRYEGVAAQ